MRRSLLLLAGAAVVSTGAALLSDDEPTAASLGGAPLTAPAPLTTPAPATLAAGASPPSPSAPPTPAPPQASAPATSAGVTRPIAGALDLDRIERVGDHYEAPTANGRRAVLTLDPELQPLAEKLLDQSRAPRGAIVVMAPDGRVLALAGRRTEDPKGSRTGTFDWRIATESWGPAASIFKLVTASALVAAGTDPDGRVCFHGGLRSVMDSNLRDDKRDSRCESLSYGVAHSNNAILAKLAYQKLEPTMLDQAAKNFGIVAGAGGSLPGNELPGVVGISDLPAVKDLSYAKAAAGFSNTTLSAAGGALIAATFATDGAQPIPRLIASIDGVIHHGSPARRTISAETARAVARMMVGTCDGGSAAKSFRGKAQRGRYAGKTGTLSRNTPFFMEHSWFVGFAPADKPEVVVSVVLGNPESWHLRGHEAARRLFDRALHTAPSEAAEPHRGKDRSAKKPTRRRVNKRR
ncbi:MAG: penicillin-binding transpeptidase domain-containing protein [Kofleriaceae bacterium]